MSNQRKIVDAYVQLSARGVEALQGGLRGVETMAKRSYSALSNIAQITVGNALAVGMTQLSSAVVEVPKKMLSANAEYEKAATMFEVLLGSADAAKKRIAELTAFAANTPFELPGILAASKQLDMAEVPLEKHLKLLQMTGDMAAAAGVDVSELGTWISRAYAMLQAGKPWGEAAMRLQELGVLSISARNKIDQLQESGASGAEVWKVFEEEAGRFGGMMEKQSKTFLGTMSNLSDGITQAMRVAGEPFFNAIKAMMDGAASIVGSSDFLGAAKIGGEMLVEQFRAMSAFIAPIIVDAQALTSSIYELAGGSAAVGYLSDAMNGLSSGVSAVYELTLSLGTAIFEMASEAGGVLNSVLVAALDAVGVKTQGFGSIVGNVFSFIVDEIKFVSQVLRNWDLVFETIALSAMNLGENVANIVSVMGQNIATVFWNIPTIAGSVAEAVSKIFENLGHNIGEIFKSAWGYLTGQDVEVQFRDMMDGVIESFADLPRMAEYELKSLSDRYGAELASIDERWANREDERQRQIDSERKKMDKAITDSTGVGDKSNKLPENDGKELLSPNTSPSNEASNQGTGDISSKEKSARRLTDVVGFWEKLQGAQTKDAFEKDAAKQRKDALDESRKQTGLLTRIASKPVGPATYA